MPNGREYAIEGSKEENDSLPVLVKNYGEFWDPETVDWGKLGTLLGCKNRNLKGEHIKITDSKGVYILYKDYIPVYAGKAFSEPLGSRLKKHWRSPRTRKRWDLFSWFEIDHTSAGGEEGKAAVITTIEALIITVCAPRLNSRKEKLKGATLLYQVPDRSDETADSENTLQELHSEIKKISTQLNNLRTILEVQKRKA
jgi:hypothetical protein